MPLSYDEVFTFDNLFNRNKEDKVIKRAYSEFLNADKENKNQDYIEAKSRKTNKGLGLGSEISQICALFYLSKLRHL